jgi:hypothetical protein
MSEKQEKTRRLVEKERQAIVSVTLDKMLDYRLKYRLQIAWNIIMGRKKAKK